MGTWRNITDQTRVVYLGVERFKNVKPDESFDVEDEADDAYSQQPDYWQQVYTPQAPQLIDTATDPSVDVTATPSPEED